MGIAINPTERAKLNYTCLYLCIAALQSLQSFLLNKQNRKTAGINFEKIIEDMALERNVVFRLEAEEYEALQAVATRRGLTVSTLLRGFVALVAAPKAANHDQKLVDLLEPGKRKRKPDNRPLAELLKSK